MLFRSQEGYILTSSLTTIKYTWEDVILRSYPNANSLPMLLIPAKVEVAVLGVNGDWTIVLYEGQKGYIFSDALTDDGNPPMPYDFQYFYTNMLKFVTDNDVKSPTTHLITTDLQNKLTYVFEKDSNGKWKQVYKWKCTVGTEATPTIKGTFYVTGRKPYFGTENYRVKYATRIRGGYYYHSVLFNATGTQITDARLGMALSHGCIRLGVANARWIYDNILDSTTIVIQ